MSTRQYTLPVDITKWEVPSGSTTIFNWEYDETRDRLLTLYEKGKEKQWNAQTRLDWSVDVDPQAPENGPDYYIPIFGSDMWEALDEAGKGELRQHIGAWMNSQFLHGEQGALICASKIVQTVPDVDSKFYAATQVMDEARHVEMYSKYLREKIELAYPINANLQALLSDVISDPRWDMTYLGMQVIIEGLALAAFALIRDFSQEPLAKAINTYVMQDEARHVAFGRLALKDYYPELTQKERDEREEFVVQACYLMRDRFRAQEVWEHLGFDVKRCLEYVEQSEIMQEFQRMLFSRIVPTVKDIGLWGEKVQRAYEDMGVIQFKDADPDSLSAQDEQLARKLDTGRGLSEEAEAAATLAGVDAKRALEVEQTIRAGGGEG
ncbi:MAG TPA: ferritin-like domain-containing protein [Actinomycetota bacterium]|nr:ferritin-like domain-containing protein [Actinomycetota bacterium]